MGAREGSDLARSRRRGVHGSPLRLPGLPQFWLFRSESQAGIPVLSPRHARQGGFQILKRLFSDKANTIPHLTHKRR